MHLRTALAVAFIIVVVVGVGTAIFNRGLSHTPYIIGLWTVLALAGVTVYWSLRAMRRWIAARRK